MAFTDPDGNNPLGWLIAGAILIGKWYHDGRKANGGEANPLDWDWKNANFSIGVGVAGGSFNAYGGIGWNNNYGVAMGYNANSGINVGDISNGTPVLAPLEDKISKGWNMAEEQIKIAFDATNEYVSQVDWGGVAFATADLVGGVGEIVVGVGMEGASGGLATVGCIALCADGGFRTISAGEKIVYYLTLQDVSHATLPSNLGGSIGKAIDTVNGVPLDRMGKGQAVGAMINDVGTFVSMGGTIRTFSQFYQKRTFLNLYNHGYTGIGYIKSLYGTGRDYLDDKNNY